MLIHSKLVGDVPMVYRWGAIGSAVIGAASSYYASEEAKKAQEEAQKAQERATKAANDRQDKLIADAQARQDKVNAENAARLSDSNQAYGESATLDFTSKKQNSKVGSANNFLVPKISKAQLSGNGSSGLGV